MTHLIDKDALVAEIEKKIRTEQGYSSGDAECGYRDCAREILSFINTLEVKEVDLNEEIEKCLKKHDMLAVGRKEFTDIGKHFFELGLKVAPEGVYK